MLCSHSPQVLLSSLLWLLTHSLWFLFPKPYFKCKHQISILAAHLCCSMYWPHSYLLSFLHILTFYVVSSSLLLFLEPTYITHSLVPCPLQRYSFLSHSVTHFYNFNTVLTNNTTAFETLIFKDLTFLPLAAISGCCKRMLNIFLQWNTSSYASFNPTLLPVPEISVCLFCSYFASAIIFFFTYSRNIFSFN